MGLKVILFEANLRSLLNEAHYNSNNSNETQTKCLVEANELTLK